MIENNLRPPSGRWARWARERRHALLKEGLPEPQGRQIANVEAYARSRIAYLAGRAAAENARITIRLTEDGDVQVLIAGDLEDVPAGRREIISCLSQQVLATL